MIELNKIICGDSLEVLKTFENNSIDFLITSPPYKNSYEGIGINRGSKTAKYHYSNDVGEPLYLIEDLSKILFPKIKENGLAFINLGFNKDSGALRPFYIIDRWLKNGWFCPDVIIWHKKNPIPNTAYQLTNSFEYIFILSKIPTYKINSDKREYIHNVFSMPIESGNSEHNACFPLELPEKIINIFTKENDLILDCFMGSGTTAEACIKNNRNFIGVEINRKYVELSEKRIKPYLMQTKLAI